MKCLLCGRNAVHDHHWIPQQVLRNAGHRDKLRDSRNLVPMCFDHHLAHENWSGHGAARMTRDHVPESAWAFARELGEWAVVRLERDYPTHGDIARPARTDGS